MEARGLVEDQRRWVCHRRPGHGEELSPSRGEVGPVAGDLGLVAVGEASDELVGLGTEGTRKHACDEGHPGTREHHDVPQHDLPHVTDRDAPVDEDAHHVGDGDPERNARKREHRCQHCLPPVYAQGASSLRIVSMRLPKICMGQE